MTDAGHEDVDALFLDVDLDGDLDLYVCSGGNERPLNDAAYADRLYLNNGQGGFSRAADALPALLTSTGSVAMGDMDGDGDPDLFVGGRVSPGRYPEPPRSHLLRNDGGRFSDVTAEWAPGLERIGMVTDARLIDLEDDGTLELVVVGEWMPITVFAWADGKLEDRTAIWGLADSHGWWSALDVADLDGDGLPELVCGNLGLNSVFKAAPGDPMTLHVADFDGNGTVDPVLCRSYGGVSYPVHTRDRMLDQMVMLRKRFQRYHPYAMARLQDIFTPSELRQARILKATTFAHTVFYNKGGRFNAVPLPNIAQLSLARAICTADVDGDGSMDLIVAGNFHGTDAQFGRYDACVGQLLLGDGLGGLEPVPPSQSGLSLTGNVRALRPLAGNGTFRWLVVRNNGYAGLLEQIGRRP